MDIRSHLSSNSENFSFNGSELSSSPPAPNTPSNVKQTIIIDLKKPNLGLAPDLVQALAKDNGVLQHNLVSPEDKANIIVKWLEYFYSIGCDLSQHPSLYALEGKAIHATDLPGPVEDLQANDWLVTNVEFIKDCLRSSAWGREADSKVPVFRFSNIVQLLQSIFKNIHEEFIKQQLENHLDRLLSPLFNTSEDVIQKQDMLELVTLLSELSETVYQDKNRIFQAFKTQLSAFSFVLMKGFLDYLSDEAKYPNLPRNEFLFLLRSVYYKPSPPLTKLLPSILEKMEHAQEYFSDTSFSQVYARFAGLYLESIKGNSNLQGLSGAVYEQRLMRFMFLLPQPSGSASTLALEAVAKIINFEAARSLPTAEQQGEACAKFVNQCYAFDRFTIRDNTLLRRDRIGSVFKAYFKDTYQLCCNDFSFIFSELSSQLDAYIKDLAKDKDPISLFQYVLSFIKSFASTLEQDIWKQRFWENTSGVHTCSRLITKILENQIDNLTKNLSGDSPTTVRVLADLVNFLYGTQEQLDISQPIKWLIESFTVSQLWNIAASYLDQAESYDARIHSVYLDLLKNISHYLEREPAVSLLRQLEAKQSFFEGTLHKQAYQELYHLTVISYFFHKMTCSQVYFTDYERDKARLQRIAGPLYTAFIRKVITREKLMYVDSPLNGEDLEIATPPLFKELDCKVVMNGEGYFEFDQDFFTEKLSLTPAIGSPLKLSMKDKTPIGYAVYIPKHPKAVFVHVYGGHQIKDKKNAARSILPSFLDRGLLAQEVAVIHLKLPDLLELSVHQSLMPTKLYEKIQACIHRFHTVFTTEPESLHQDLIALQGLPIGLYGASFGGPLTFYHSLMYPNSFTRYISHSGCLDVRSRDSVRGDINDRFPVTQRVQDLQDTYLALHTANDPCVNLQCSLGFYDKADAQGKRVKLSIIPKGGRSVIGDASSIFGYTGHFYPVLKKSFDFYTKEIVDFLKKDDPMTPLSKAISRWRAHAYTHYMAKYTYAESNSKAHQLKRLCTMVLSHMYLLYKNACVFRGKDTLLAEPSRLLDTMQTDRIWDEYYLPLYKAYELADFVLNNPKDLNSLFERNDLNTLFTKATERFLENHWIHFEEMLNMKIDKNTVDLSSVVTEICAAFKRSLDAQNSSDADQQAAGYNVNFSSKHLEFLATLYMEYPQLMEDSALSAQLELIEIESPQLKEDFLKIIRQNRKLALRAIRTSVDSLHTDGRLLSLIQDYRKEIGKNLDSRSVA